jgi:hypothetical protein
MLSNLTECTPVYGSQALFDVLDDRSLLVKGASGYDEGLGSPKLRHDV